MKIRKARRTIAVVGACFMHTACDAGSEVAVADWQTFEARLSKLEAENTGLRAELEDAVKVADLEGYATVDQCGACVQPAQIEGFITLDDLPAPVDVSGLATTASVQAIEDALGERVTDQDLATYVSTALEGYVTHVELTAGYYDKVASDARYQTAAAADAKYATQAALLPYIDATELAQAIDPLITQAELTLALDPFLTQADLSGYALKTDLPDFTKFALKTDLPDLSLYALKSSLPDFTTFALKSQLPNMALYALKTDLNGYAKTADLSIYALKTELALYALESEVTLTDLSAYALKSELPNLSNYALKSDLPNTSSFALKSELPDLTNYALRSELDQYALDTDLTEFDGAIRLIDETIDLYIPEDYPTLQAAMTWLDGYSIAQNAAAIIHLDDGVYPFPSTGFSPTHRDGGRVYIVGNTVDPSAVVLDFPDGGGIVVNRGRLGFLDGVTVRGARGRGNEGGQGIFAAQGGVIQLGTHVVVEDFMGAGVRAVLNGVVLAEKTISRRNGQGFFTADGGAVYAQNATADSNFGHGFAASIAGVIEASGFKSTNNQGRGLSLYAGSAFYSAAGFVPAPVITGNYGDGVNAAYSSAAILSGATITGNGAHPQFSGNGVGVYDAASADVSDANVTANDGAGITTWLGGMVNAPRSFANGNLRGNGYLAGAVSGIDAPGSEAKNNSGNGYEATHGGALQATATYDFSTNPATIVKRSVADHNGQAGFRAGTGGVIEARDSESTWNQQDGYHAWTNGTLAVDRSSASHNQQTGYGSYASSAINAPGSSATSNSQGGFHAGLGAVIETGPEYSTGTRSVAELNGGSGFNAWGNGAISASGALAKKNDHGFSVHDGGFIAANRWTRTDNNVVVYDYVAESTENTMWGFSASNGGIIEATEANSKKNGWDGFWARLGAVIEASHSEAVENGRDGFNASDAAAIAAVASLAQKNGTSGYGLGYHATSGSMIDADADYGTGEHSVADDNSGGGFEAWNGSTIGANGAQAINNDNDGFHAYLGSSINAGQFTDVTGLIRKVSISKNNRRHGYAADNGSSIDVHGAVAEQNGDAGFIAANGSSLDANSACLGPNCTDNLATTATNNGGDGFRADNASSIQANSATVTADADHGRGRAFNGSRNSAIDATNAIVNGYGDGFYMWLGAAAHADGAQVSNIRGWTDQNGYFNGSAFAAHNGAAIHATNTTVSAVALGNGYQAHMGSLIMADNSNLNQGPGGGTANQGYSAHGHSLIDASNSHASHVTQNCFSVDMGSALFADGSTATDCGGQGFVASQNSVAQLQGAQARECGNQGFFITSGSVATGGDLVADQCGLVDHNGYLNPGVQVQGLSYMNTRDIQVTGSGNDGLRVESGSYFESYSDCFEDSNGQECTGDVRNTLSDNDGHAVNVFNNAYAHLAGLLASGNQYGANAGTMSGLDINKADLSDTREGPAVSGNSMAFVNADQVISDGSRGGMTCGGSYCSARGASFAGVNDGTAECDQNGYCQCVANNNCPEFGLNAHSGAFFDINGATLSGSFDVQYAPDVTNQDGTRLIRYQ